MRCATTRSLLQLVEFQLRFDDVELLLELIEGQLERVDLLRLIGARLRGRERDLGLQLLERCCCPRLFERGIEVRAGAVECERLIENVFFAFQLLELRRQRIHVNLAAVRLHVHDLGHRRRHFVTE
jgi:hypothetical protein